MVLTERGAESLFKALASPSKPNAALKKAFAKLKRQVSAEDQPKKKVNLRNARLAKQYESVHGLRDMFRIIQQLPLRKFHLDFIVAKFKITKKQTAAIAGVSTRTLLRWKSSTKLSPLIAESIFKIAELYDNGMIVFDDDEESFQTWMRTSIPSLNHQVPIDLLDTRTGIQLVIEQLLRMEYGIN